MRDTDRNTANPRAGGVPALLLMALVFTGTAGCARLAVGSGSDAPSTMTPSTMTPPPPHGGVHLSVPEDLEPVRDVDEIVAQATQHIRSMGESIGDDTTPIAVTSVSLIRGADLPAHTGQSRVEAGSEDNLVWTVRANGTFVSHRGRTAKPLTAPRGYLLINDATGMFVGIGWP
jgi:hypothetical protein